MPTEHENRRLAAIMFTDMVGYSALTQRDEALALSLLDEHEQLLRPIFAQHGLDEARAAIDQARRAQPKMSRDMSQRVLGISRPEVDARRSAEIRPSAS